MARAPLSPLDFRPAERGLQVDPILRPSLSYWEDTWRRLRGNRRATLALVVVIALLTASAVGPVVWTVDPSAQDLDQVSKLPWADRRARIVDGAGAADPSLPVARATGGSDPTGMDLRIVGEATTKSVVLEWNLSDLASGYRVYRHIDAIAGGEPLGLPLAEVPIAGPGRFIDRLNLQPHRYYYAVAALDAAGEEQAASTIIPADVVRVLSEQEAIARGFAASKIFPGAEVELPFHPLGTDALGRDMLARLIHGSRVSLFIGIAAPWFYVMIGVGLGSLAGLRGGAVDQLIMRFTDFVVALPFLLFMILFKIGFGIGPGESGILPMLVALVLLSWPGTTRLVRGQVLQIREEGYLEASRLLGAPTRHLLLHHLVPNVMGVVLVTLTFAIPSAIFTEAFLSFIGMGVVPPTPSWGSMCNDGTKTMLMHPHELVLPATLISLTVLAFNVLGDGLRDALDARLRSRE